ncbi:MAG: hypothetical protein PHI12_07625 [Dehalococcoidales bacterium]|nr:hypothetical protein [Dehalococcoidales bacterium]
MVPAVSWTERLKKWERNKDEQFARAILSKPEITTISKEIPFPGTVVIMGDRRKGKTGLAFEIMDYLHSKRDLPGCLFLPFQLEKPKRRLLPSWISVVTSLKDLPKKAVIVVDEASQTAHARRTQSGEAVTLDNLIGVSGQREQLIIFIAHHSSKLDRNVVMEAQRVIWKEPTQAHAMFERSEMQMFTRRAIEVFANIPTDRQKLRSGYVMDTSRLRFGLLTNNLPSWWCDELSRIFENGHVAA